MVADLQPPQCPVCAARWRASRPCSRCGADLTPLMTLAHAAWQARQAARRALAEGDGARALALAEHAQRLHATAAGGRLRLLAAWLAPRCFRPKEKEMTPKPKPNTGEQTDD